jgi:cardiolipin synthase
MKAAGIEVEIYNPVRWHSIARMNNTGGVGIADEWSGNAQDRKHWRDTHFRVEGPAVAQMQAAFMENWIEVTGNVLHSAAYFPELPRAGNYLAQFFISSPGGGGDSMQLMYAMSIAAAAKRGVGVQIIVPGQQTDSPAVRRASRSTLGRAAARGRRDLRVPADVFPLQGHGRRRRLGLGRLDQLRHALVQHQRPGQPQRL